MLSPKLSCIYYLALHVPVAFTCINWAKKQISSRSLHGNILLTIIIFFQVCEWKNIYFITIGSNGAIWLASLPLLMKAQRTLLTSMCHAMPLSALKHGWLRHFDDDILVKNKSTVARRGLCSYGQQCSSSQ